MEKEIERKHEIDVNENSQRTSTQGNRFCPDSTYASTLQVSFL